MANDVTIVVEASLGDTLLKLELAKVAVDDLGDAASRAGSSIGSDTDRNSFSGRLRNLRYTLSNMGDRGPLGMVTRAFGNLASAMLAPIQMGADFAKQFEEMGTVSQILIGTVTSLGVAIVALAGAIAIGVFAAESLASILGTLVAITADFVAPLTLVAGLLGGLAAGFVIGGKRAAEGGGKLNAFSDIVDTLGSMFQKTSSILAHVFLPYFVELGHAAEQALNFLDKIIKLPLGQAFHELDTQGVKMLGQFVDRVAEVLSKPIRLAFKVAFTDTAFSNMVADWWHRFTGFLFGYTQTHQAHLGKWLGPLQKSQVDGILQPLIDWFNRHHFTKQGIKIGQQILAGIMDSDMRGKIIDFFIQIWKDAGVRAFKAVRRSAFDFVKWAGREIRDLANGAANQIKNFIGKAWEWVKTKAGNVFDSISSTIHNIWNRIVSFIESPLSISIDWPSPPSWLTNIFGGGGGGGSTTITGGGQGGLGRPGQGGGGGGGGTGPRAAMVGGSMIVVHVHGADLSDAPTRRRIGQQLGKEIAMDWHRRARGH